MEGCLVWFVQFSLVQVGDGRQEGVEEADCLGESCCRVWQLRLRCSGSFIQYRGDGESIEGMDRGMHNAGFFAEG